MQKIDVIGREKEILASIHSRLSELKAQGKRGWVLSFSYYYVLRVLCSSVLAGFGGRRI